MEKGNSILLLAGETTITRIVCDFLKKESHRFLITSVPSVEVFSMELQGKIRDIILLCVDIPGDKELIMIEEIRSNYPFVPIFIIANTCPISFASELFLKEIAFTFYISIKNIQKLPEKIETALHANMNDRDCRMAYEGLLQKELEIKDILDNIPDTYLRSDEKRCLKMINQSGIVMFGYDSVQEMIGMPISSLYFNTAENDVVFNKLEENSQIKDYITKGKRKDGSEFWASLNAQVYCDEKGTIKGAEGTIRDISERKRAEDALKREQNIFSNLFDNIPDSIYFKDTESRFVRINNSMAQSFGLQNPDEVIGKTDFDFFNKHHARDAFADEQKIIETGNPMIGKIELAKHSGGLLRWVSTTKIPMRNEEGAIIGIMGISRNITDSKIAEEALMQERKLLRTLIENLPSAVFAKDKHYRKVIVNNNHIESVLGHLKQLGKNSEIDILGKTDFEVFPKEIAEVFFEDDQKVVRDGISIINNLEFGISRKGEKIWNLVSKIPLRDIKGEIVGMVGITTDITELKTTEQELYDQKEKLEKQNEKYSKLNNEYKKLNNELRKSNEELLAARIKAEENDRLKTAFLQNMSHEIRTPMNAIMGFSELLPLEFENKERLERFTSIIYQRSSDLLDIINGILDISKIESGQLPVNYEKFNLKPVFCELETTFNEYRTRINKEHVLFSLSVKCEDVNLELVSDKVKLKQIFINLIGNAFKFTEKGKIEAGSIMTVDRGLVFFVSDTGIGIPKEKHKLIFERFMQINDKSASVTHGTGLGLSIVKGLVNLLGGKIWLESEPGVGSTFYFTIANDEIPKIKSME
jgi:two-component system, sensor histidine kinase and response regulator